jgi:uncharacterized protein YfaS (alpha-2-macroglobulin family)
MSTQRKPSPLILLLSLPIFIAALWAITSYVNHLPERLSQHETLVFGQDRFTPGSQAALRVVVRDSKDGAPLPGAQIRVSLQPQGGGKKLLVFDGTTNANGNANIQFDVPADLAAEQNLVVETRSSLGSDAIERPVQVARDYRLLLSSDKPVYQPGQVIHLRLLALGSFDRFPAAGQPVSLTIADGKGNKVFRKTLTTSDFGVAAVDFTLASEVNTGAYKITATLGNTISEKTVTVENYVLPKFDIQIQTEKPFYLPGERVQGSLKADYFFGKPVAGGVVQIQGFTFDVQQNQVFSLEGQTDETGTYTFEFDLPEYIAGSDLEGGLGRFYLQATLTDLAQHSETRDLSLPVSGSTLVIDAIPEGGQFRPGVENILYILTSYPDGAPAETRLQLTFYENGQSRSIETGPYGLAEVRFTPANPYQQFAIQANDAQGHTAQRDFYFEGEYVEESVLLRPEKPVYRVGEAMRLAILTSQPRGSVYLDIVREGQTVSTRSVEVDQGQAEVIVDLTPDLYGTLELHAYKILRSGVITRDTRLVVVDAAEDLSINLGLGLPAGSDSYRPGESAKLDFQVAGQGGAGVKAVLGLAVVDEAVFALAEQDPGFAKLYFLLEQELLQPKYDLHGYSLPDLIQGVPVSSQPALEAIEDAAQASLADEAARSFGPHVQAFSLTASSRQDAVQRAYALQERYYLGLSKALYLLLLILPLLVIGLVGFALHRERSLGRSLVTLAFFILTLALVLLSGASQAGLPWSERLLRPLIEFIDQLSGDDALLFVACLALAGPLAYLALAVAAWRRKDAALGWSLGLVFIFITVLVALVSVAMQAEFNPDEGIILAGVLAMFLLPLAFLLRAAGFVWSRRLLASAAALGLAGFLVVGPILLAYAAASSSAPNAGFAGGPVLVEEGIVEAPMPAPMAMMPAPTAAAQLAREPEKSQEGAARDASAAAEPPRLRQYFPETMLWMPEAITDEQGRLNLEVPLADSITTWRVTALASSQDGRLGSLSAPLRVFQDFFIDLDLPVALTVGDEIAVPVGVFNYLPEAQNVRLELAQGDWFELLAESSKEITIAANDITVVYFRLRVIDFGRMPLKVTAWGSRMSDAIQKEVRVYPDGKPLSYTQSDRLTPGETVQQTVTIPAEAIPGTQSLLVKIYPGVLSQVVEGLDSILRMPNGCFEQTSSTTYPNVLVLDYLKSTSQASPEAQMKAEEYINLGYQRLATFEVDGGGFSLFGDAPADRMLTAYGLQEFADMSRVYEIDPDLIERAARWLLAQQNGDGTWENDRGLVHESTWSSLGDQRLPVTAYIVWSLVDAGFGAEPGTQRGLAYVRENQSKAEDPYVLALVANALVAADLQNGEKPSTATLQALDRLAGMAVQDGNSAYWPSGVATFMGAEGQTGSIETTALAALAFLRSNTHPDLANAALTYLVRQKDSFGTWYSTQATVLTLKALIQSVRAGAENVDASVTISLNGGQTRTLTVDRSNFDVVQMVSFDDVNPGRENTVTIQVEGQGNLMYQVSGGYYLPWEKLALYPELVGPQDLVTIDVRYDRSELAVDDTVQVDVTVALNQPGGRAESALIDLGLPPGFSLQAEDLQALVTRFNDTPADYPYPKIERFELTGRQILIYVTNLSAGNPLQFSYRLKARFPLVAQAPASSIYDYYNPQVSGEALPQTLTVR